MLSVRRSTDGRSWVLRPSARCPRPGRGLGRSRADDRGGRNDIALDELRWLLSGCSEFIAAHVLLGDLARDTGDTAAGPRALRRRLPARPANASPRENAEAAACIRSSPISPFFEAGRGLVWSLEKLGKPQMAEEVVATLCELDPADPLRLRAMLDEMRSGGAPIVDLMPKFPNT